MTWERFYTYAKAEYEKNKGERFFTFPLLWACLTEKHRQGTGAMFSQEKAPQALSEELARLLAGYPLQYYMGYWEFCGHDYLCRPPVLIPREDTALLCQKAREALPPGGRLLDACCGSGIVAISVLLQRPDCTATSFDLSPEAVALTQENARRLGVADRLTCQPLDLFDPQLNCLLAQGNYQVLASNPPYIPTQVVDTLAENLRHEPRLALDGGPDGLRFYRHLWELYQLFPHLTQLWEIGYDQKQAIETLTQGLATVYKDESGNPRCASLPPQNH